VFFYFDPIRRRRYLTKHGCTLRFFDLEKNGEVGVAGAKSALAMPHAPNIWMVQKAQSNSVYY
jgi:hypothetical protein